MTLYLVATPIGNLADITYRAVDTLQASQYILCEDTRHSMTLLSHYQIKKPLHSFHKFNEASAEERIIEDLQSGASISLISDAGTPGIADPGSRLIKRCIKEGIQVIAIPGPCAAIQALVSSGLNTEYFQFRGFLPKKAEELRRLLKEILNYTGTSICYESPNRLLAVIKQVEVLAPVRELVVARELTKKFEEIIRGNATHLLQHWHNKTVKGEIVLLIAGQDAKETIDWETLTPVEHVSWMEQAFGLSRQEAIKVVAQVRGVPKRTIYNEVLDT